MKTFIVHTEYDEMEIQATDSHHAMIKVLDWNGISVEEKHDDS